MRLRILLSSLVAAICVGTLGWTSSATANVNVSIGVGDTIMSLTGQTSPDAFVTVKDGDQVIGTTTADATGTFSKVFAAQTPGIHNLSIYGKTPGGALTDSALISVNFREHETTDVFVFLPTVITLSGTELAPGTGLQAYGQTIPYGELLFYIDQSAPRTLTAAADGTWALLVSAGLLSAGNHSIVAYVTDGNGRQSSPTVPRFFTILPNIPVGNPVKGGSPSVPIRTPSTPVISLPKDNSVSVVDTITVVGVSDAFSEIEVWRGGRLMGSVLTDRNGGWFIPIRLLTGQNELRARACRASVCSAFSGVINVSYNPADEAPSAPFRVLLDPYRFQTAVSQSISLNITVQNGQAPYSYDIGWGDDTDQFVSTKDPVTSIRHSYDSAGLKAGKIIVTDADGKVQEGFFTVSVAEISGDQSVWKILASLLLIAIVIALVAHTNVISFVSRKISRFINLVLGRKL